MSPTCHDPEKNAIIRGTVSGPTTMAGSDRPDGAPSARNVPKATTTPSTSAIPSSVVAATAASATTTDASPKNANAATRRRSNRSASAPETTTSTAAGRNSASPIRPRSSGRRVESKTNLPSAVNWAVDAMVARVMARRSATAERLPRTSRTPGPG